MPVTIRDVAREAGVSVTTVSHVLSKQGRVAEETRLRVEQAVSDLGYRANVHAQQLVTRRSRTLSIQISRGIEQSGRAPLVPNSEYFLELLNGAAEKADELGYALIVTPPGASVETVNAYGIDGAVLVDPTGDEPILAAGGKLVTTGRPLRGEGSPYTVDNDHRAAASMMLDHLRSQGYERPALLVSDSARSYSADLVAGYHEWADSSGLRPVVVEMTSERADLRALLKKLLAKKPRVDALYASSEDLALDVSHELRSLGLTVPADLGLCSAVDSRMLELTSPSITGTWLNPRTIGHRAVDLLVRLVDGEATQTLVADSATVPTEIRARVSTAKVS